ncbi:MAG TPA: ImmA/IrrE family metallo-endopeptidase [Chondromyces sp.]|nr:ImmA/IrrE family metallo-endopeptidase [Chondromyces sp.]
MFGFRCASVFDVGQTDGKELPSPDISLLEGGGERERLLLADWTEKIGIPVRFEDTGEANGYFHREENYIAVHKDRGPIQQLKTLVHEYAHYLLHRTGAEFERESRKIKEAQAEAVAYVVMRRFGYETGGYSFGYIAGWCGDISIMERIGADIVKCSGKAIKMLEGGPTASEREED